MNTFKNAKCIILPSEQKSNLYFYKEGKFVKDGKLVFNTIKRELAAPQHLYIISDEEIQEGDWCIMFRINDIPLVLKYKYGNKETMFANSLPSKKILAATDSSLRIARKNSHPNSIWKLDGTLLPTLSKEFISLYIEEYNKGNVIEEVEVEYEIKDVNPMSLSWKEDYLRFGLMHKSNMQKRPKLNSNNEINIRLIKESWNREELDILLKKHELDIVNYLKSDCPYAKPSFHHKWIKENL
jgi:hypothetical protein